MTSGKSTVGPIVANVLGWNFYDLDKIISEELNKSIVEIFNEYGESEFRKLENYYLQKLSKDDNVVISLGGGTIVNDENVLFMKKLGKIIYLRAAPEIIYKRIKHKIDRPLFRDLVLAGNSQKEIIDRIHKLLTEREKYYYQADLIIDSDERPIGHTVDKIANEIRKILHEKNRSSFKK